MKRQKRIAVLLGLLWLGFALMQHCNAGVNALGQQSEGYVDFNFEGVDLHLLAKIVGDITGRRIVVPDNVKGKVTIVTPERITIAEVYPLFMSVLEASGYSIVCDGSLYRVVPLEPAALPTAPVITGDVVRADAGLITRVIALRHVNAVDVVKALSPFVPGAKQGALTAFPPSNHLIVTAGRNDMSRINKVLKELDQPGASRVAEVVHLKHASADEIARELSAAMLGSMRADTQFSRRVRQVAEGKGGLPSDVVVIPASHANSIVLVGPPVSLEEMKRMVRLLDTSVDGKGPLNAVFLKYLSAEAAAKSLNALLSRQDEKKRRRIAIEPSVANNALIIDASPRDFEWVKSLIERLDKVPQQVLTEVLIAEVSMSKNLDLGVEWSTIDMPAHGRTTAIGRSRPDETDQIMDLISKGIFPRGLAVGIARGTYRDAAGNELPRIPFLLRALAEDRDVKILSSVPLWAQNNTEATVSVVENIPILRSTIEGGAGTARDVIQNIDRVDVGIKLKLTPQVNPDNRVTMQLNPSIEAIIDRGPPDKPFTPTIAKREVSTTVTVPDRATIVISGLIREDHVKRTSKVPLLGDIPFLGALFRSTSDAVKRSNLLIFVTPHIVTDMREADELKRQWQQRTSLPDARISFTGKDNAD